MSGDLIDTLLSPEDREFRKEVRAFIQSAVPEAARRNADIGKGSTKTEAVDWLRRLHDKGWSAPAWPKTYGGAEWSVIRQMVFNAECGMGGAPKVPGFGTKMVGPVIYTFGSEAQKAFYLPRILNAEDWWCQGFSEPNSGSDLASLRTRAVREGDHYLVNGQKIWTTKAQYANRMFCLVRTSDEDRPQKGISFLLIDMDSPGVTVRPIISIDGSHTLNEVFLENVRVPAENLVGKEGFGWTYAKFLLGNERADTSGAGRCRRQMGRIKALAASGACAGEPLTDNYSFMAALTEAEIALTALELTELRYLSAMAKGNDVGIGTSVLKMRGSLLQQELTRLLREAIGPEAALMGEEAIDALAVLDAEAARCVEGVIEDYLYSRAATIYGGSNEIQKNIISRVVLAG